MKSLVVTEKGYLEVIDVSNPTYNSKQALVKMISCGICGTDETLIQRSFKGVPKETYPIMLGHEAVGRVEETGAEVTSFEKGDIVFLPFNDPGENTGSAWGGFSEYGIINDEEAYNANETPEAAFAQSIIPTDIDPVDATVIVTLREVYSAIKYFNIQSSESIVVVGSGPVAVTFIKLLKLNGIKSIIGVARSEHKKEVLQNSGATYVINSSNSNTEEEVRKLFPDGVDRVLDAVGSSEVINQGLTLIKDRGEILCYGVPKQSNMQVDWSRAPYNWKINFQQMPYKYEEGEVSDTIINWVQSGKINLKDFVSDYFPFNDVSDAFEKMRNKEILKKAIITFE